MQSCHDHGSRGYPPLRSTASFAAQGFDAVLAKAKCTNLACLREKSTADVEALHGSMTFTGPAIDGVSLTAAPADLIAAGGHSYNSRVPVMIGSNRDEMAFFLPLYYTSPQLTEAQFDHQLKTQAGLSAAQIESIKKVYTSKDYPYPTKRGLFSKWYWMLTRVEVRGLLRVRVEIMGLITTRTG
jgi:carboxylesterase type B